MPNVIIIKNIPCMVWCKNMAGESLQYVAMFDQYQRFTLRRQVRHIHDSYGDPVYHAMYKKNNFAWTRYL